MLLDKFCIASRKLCKLRIPLLEHFPDLVHAFIESPNVPERPFLIYLSHPEIYDLHGTLL